MDDERQQRDAEERQRLGILEPGRAPPFPARAAPDDAEISDYDKEDIADAAWNKSGGSIVAFEQLCREHVAGQIDLLGDGRGQVQKRQPETEHTAGSTEERAGDRAPTTDNPAGAAHAPGVGAELEQRGEGAGAGETDTGGRAGETG